MDRFFIVDGTFVIVWLLVSRAKLTISADETYHAASGKRWVESEFALRGQVLDSVKSNEVQFLVGKKELLLNGSQIAVQSRVEQAWGRVVCGATVAMHGEGCKFDAAWLGLGYWKLACRVIFELNTVALIENFCGRSSANPRTVVFAHLRSTT